MRRLLPTTVLTVALLILAVSIFAQAPMYFNYQGRLTDDAGEPITNISPGVKMIFTIWNDPTASDPANEEWTSGAVYVSVEDGLFDYQLGPLSGALLTDILTSEDHWLGITVGTDPEILPRSKLASVPYALHAATAGSVTDIYVNEAGDAMTGDLVFDFLDDTQTDAIIDVEPTYANIELYDNLTLTSKLWGWTFGELNLYHSNNGNSRANLIADIVGGELELDDNTGATQIKLDAGSSGDISAIFPNNAVNSYEILDEPGISNNGTTGFVALSTSMDDLQSLTIEIPASGYIYLEGWCMVEIYGSTAHNYAYIQIDETSGGSWVAGNATIVGMSQFPSSGYHTSSAYVNRIYYKTAGTYDFILEGMKLNATHTIECHYSNLTATYYPTSYTPIKAFSSSPEGHPEAKAVTAVEPITGDEQTVYEVDLRYYELKAKEARIKALEAEMELQQAKREAARGNR